MPKGIKPKALLVVATKDLKDFKSKELAYFEDENGGHITNATFDTHANPGTGAIVNGGDGTAVKVTIKEEDAVGITCANEACGVALVMDQEQAALRDSITCVACATKIKYDPSQLVDQSDLDAAPAAPAAPATVAPAADAPKVEAGSDADTDDMEEDEEDDGENGSDLDLEDDVVETLDDTTDLVDAEDEDDTDLEDEEDALEGEDELDGEEDEDEEEAAMADTHLIDMVDPTAEVAFVDVPDGRVLAMVGDVVVATLAADADVDSGRVMTAGYARSFNRAVSTAGLETSLEEAGFDLVSISAPATIAALARKDDERIQAAVGQGVHEQMSKMRNCLNIAVAGSTVGFFAKKGRSGTTALTESLQQELANVGVRNPKALARKVLATNLPKFLKSVMETATELSGKDDSSLELLAEQIGDVDTSILAPDTEDEVETAALEERLEVPAREDIRTTRKPVAETADTLVAGLFS